MNKWSGTWSLPLLLFLGSLQWLHAQDADWWRNNVGWDGITPYHQYLKLTAAGMGPNALPIPELHQQWDTTSSFTLSAASHHRPGETTVNSRLDLRWQAHPRFRLRVHLVPLEWYSTSHALKTERRIHFLSYDHQWAGGDIYVESSVRLPVHWTFGLQSEIRAGIKTASGTNLGAARYTDTPGYFFDVDVYRTFGDRRQFDWEAMLGFYAYQTYQPGFRQNDCLLYGASIGWHNARLALRSTIRGYCGYFQDGDCPVLGMMEMRWGKRFRPWQGILQVSAGLYDWPFTSVQIGIRRDLFLAMSDQGEQARQ